MGTSTIAVLRKTALAFALALIFNSPQQAAAQIEGYQDETHIAAHGDLEELDQKFKKLSDDENYIDAARLGEEFLAKERQIHAEAHEHLAETALETARFYLRAGDVLNADRLHRELISIANDLTTEEPDKIKEGLERICRRFDRIVERQDLYIEPNQLTSCAIAFKPKMMERFVSLVNEKVARGAKRAARKMVEQRAATLDSLSDEDFTFEIDASRSLVSALGLTGTKAFELDMGELADRMYRRARQFAEKHLPDDDPFAATSKATLANRLDVGGEHIAAEILHAEAWQTLVEAGMDDTVLGMSWAANYALNQIYLGKFEEAIPLLESALNEGSRELGKTNPLYLTMLSNYVIALNNSGREEEAESIVTEAIVQLDQLQSASRDEFENKLDADKQEQFFLFFLNNIAASEFERKAIAKDRDVQRAIDLQERVYSRTQRLLGEENEQSILAALNLARSYAYSRTSAERAQRLAKGAFETWSTNELQRNLVDIEKSKQPTFQLIDRLASLTVLDTYGIDQPPQTTDAVPKIVFRAMQEESNTDASTAIAREFARSAASREDPALLKLVDQREQLLDRYIENERKIRESFADAESGRDLNREDLQQDNAAIAAEFPNIEKKIADEFPAYFAITRAEPLTQKSARQLMADDEAALIAIPSIEGMHVALVTRKGVSWSKSSLGYEKLGEATRRLQWFLGADVSFLPNDDLSFMEMNDEIGPLAYDFETANLLYRELIAPFAEELEGKTHLFVASSGPLTSLPLGVLVSQMPDTGLEITDALRTTKWLSDDFAIVQIPSLQALAFQRSYRDTNELGSQSSNLVGFGDPLLDGEAENRGLTKRSTLRSGARAADYSTASLSTDAVDAEGKPIIDQARLKALARLPGTSVELRALQEVLDAPEEAIFLGGDATETKFRETDLSDMDVLVFATHGLVAGDIVGLAEPGLVFTPPDEPTRHDDGFLSASEIASLRINADWVILSACNTASGSGELGAPGLSGLAKSFFFAGARNLLASHWPVRDDVAPELTVRTIELANSNSGISRAQAFQQAMRQIRDDTRADDANDSWAHPNSWAAFTLIGDR